MKAKVFSVVICSICIILMSLLIAKIEHANTISKKLIAKEGIVNLTQNDFGKKGVIKLDGQWEFYDGKLLSEEELHSGKYASVRKIVDVPGRWNNYGLVRNNPKAFGFGTYHLRILAHNTLSGVYGIKTTNIGMSNKIMVNGQIIGRSGIPGKDKGSYVPGNVPYVTYFNIENNIMDIIIWVANYDYTPYSGIVNSIFFGTQNGIDSLKEKSVTNDLVIVTSCLIVGLMFFVLYIYRRKERYLLYFSLYNITGSIYFLTHGEKLFFKMFPHMDYLFFAKLQYLSAAINIVMLILYLYYLFPTLFKRLTTRILLVIALLFVPVGIFTPLSVQSMFSSSQMIFIQGFMIYSVYTLTLGILNGIENSFYVGLGSLILSFIVLVNVQNVLGNIQLDSAMIYSEIFFVLTHSFLIAAKLSKTYDKVEALSSELFIMDKNKDEFLAKTSHEFKTPLHGIINITKLYLEQANRSNSDEQFQNLALVIDIANRLSKLVNDILDISKIKEGKLKIEPKYIHVNKYLDEVIKVSHFIYEDNSNELICDIEEALPLIKVDKDRFMQIMYNLIDNAMINTNSGKVIVKAICRNDLVEISVSDTGGGIEESKAKDIFKPFTQLSEKVNENRSGAGLGLSIVKQLTELMGGTIWFQSKLGEGSCFTVTFHSTLCGEILEKSNEDDLISDNIVLKKGYELHINTPFIINPEGEITILIADDNFSNLKVLIDGLSSNDHKIIGVKNGEEVLDRLRGNENIDLVILDVMMPDMSGYEISNKIREKYNLVELPILILTAAVNASSTEIALKMGANDFLYKPFQLSELRARVNSLIMMKKSAVMTSKYEIAFLHAQVKPHFLFNALNTIADFCETDSPEAGRLIISLSKYLRGTLDFANLGNLVSVDRELTLVKAYLDIEKARFNDLKIELQIDDEINVQLPPMSLQILVENAVKHGINNNDGEGTVRLSIKKFSEGTLFTVEDDGIGMSSDKIEKLLKTPDSQNSIGLFNINTRLTRLYGEGLSIISTPGKGTKISFMIR